jgi:hypothetical protein
MSAVVVIKNLISPNLEDLNRAPVDLDSAVTVLSSVAVVLSWAVVVPSSAVVVLSPVVVVLSWAVVVPSSAVVVLSWTAADLNSVVVDLGLRAVDRQLLPSQRLFYRPPPSLLSTSLQPPCQKSPSPPQSSFLAHL